MTKKYLLTTKDELRISELSIVEANTESEAIFKYAKFIWRDDIYSIKNIK